MKFSRDAAILRIPAPHLLKQGQLQLAGASFRDFDTNPQSLPVTIAHKRRSKHADQEGTSAVKPLETCPWLLRTLHLLQSDLPGFARLLTGSKERNWSELHAMCVIHKLIATKALLHPSMT